MPRPIKAAQQRESRKKERFWILLASVSMTIYILWRIFFTVPDHEYYGWMATICGIVLVVSEAVSALEGMEHFARLRKKTVPDMPVVPHERYPHVDILIATHNEEPDLLYKTVNGCKYMEYPDRSKVHIFLCDDGNREEVAALAAKMGVGYFGLAENRDAKAGNLNHALSRTCSPWVVTFDADMIPTHAFLMETIPYTFLPVMKKLDDGTWADREEAELDEKYKIGFIQTPQSFYNPDLFQFNFYSEDRIPNEQDYFFRKINVGRNSTNAVIYAGSNTLLSRQALDEVGGIATDTITEDFETGIKIQARGYSCYAIDKTLAHGLAPTDIDSLIKQRVRWGRGCITSLRHVHLLLNPHLKLNTKLSYIACWMYWWAFFRRFVFIVSPILFVLFHIPSVICTMRELGLICLPAFVLYNHALKETSGRIRNRRWSNTVDTVIFPYLIIPILLESLFIRQKTFHVTKKTRQRGQCHDLQLALPHIMLLFFDVVALVLALFGTIQTRNYGGVIILYWLGVNALHLGMAVFFMAGRKNLRSSDRFCCRVPVEVEYLGKTVCGVTNDISETGMSILLSRPLYLPHGEGTMKLRIWTGRYEAAMRATCIHVEQRQSEWKYGVQITKLEGRDRDEYFQILYDRDHGFAKEISAASSIFDDLILNVYRRTRQVQRSRRQLPRVALQTRLHTVDGREVYAEDTTFEYMKFRDSGDLPERIELRIPGSAVIMVCVRWQGRPGLYHVENWEELLFHDAYSGLFAQVEEVRGELVEAI